MDEITPKSTKEFFTLFSDLDENYKQLVNNGFCTKVCMGLCNKGEDCYTKYAKVEAKNWEKYDRTWDSVVDDGFSMGNEDREMYATESL